MYQEEIENLLTNSGININSLKVTSKSASNGGWDWIIVNVGYIKDNTTNYKFVTKTYSGNSTETGEANKTTLWFALGLYLDFINLLLLILRIFGNNK